MARVILMDELHVELFAPRGLTEAEYNAIHQALDTPTFRADLTRAVRQLLRRDPSLSKVRVRVSR